MSSLLKTVGVALTKNYGAPVTQSGGAKIVTDAGRGRRLMFAAFIWTLVILLIKVVLVHWGWNYLGPRLMPESYRPITVADSVALVILAQALVN